MKKLGFLAVILLLVVWVSPTFAAYPDTAPSGGICMRPGCNKGSSRSKPANQDPDVNIVLRQFIRVPGTPNIIDFEHDIDAAPQLCALFNGNQLHAFTSLYAVGVYEGIDKTKNVETSPPHMTGFEMKPGETVYAPPLTAFGGVGAGYDAILLYADSNSLAIKYTLDDDVVKGYTIHILGIAIDRNLKALYDQANKDGRWYLPGIIGGQEIGTAKGSEIWVSIRDTGQFMDPRWLRDWWKDCPGTRAPETKITKFANPPGFTTTPATPYSGGGPKDTRILPNGMTIPIFPPLGSLEACPQEIPYVPPPPSGSNGEFNREACKAKFIEPDKWYDRGNCQPCGDPDSCCDKDPTTDCNWEKRYWCRPEQCAHQSDPRGCNGGPCRCGAGLLTWCVRGSDIIGALNPKKGDLNLPACVPTANPSQKCVSECSEPIKISQDVRLYSDKGCLRTGDCLTKMGLKDNSLQLPFVRDLADYFAGVIDAEHVSADQLDTLQKNLRERIGVQEFYDQAGVAKKLLPSAIQDQLKCQFINYVKEKKAKGANTKYAVKDKEFQIYSTSDPAAKSKNITEIECPPTINKNSKYQSLEAWAKDWAGYWTVIPLFQNDDAQGKIEFVNPALFSTKEKGNDPRYPNINLGPIYVSMPDTNRLRAATALIQSAIVPAESRDARNKAITEDPKKNLPTYGKEIDPGKDIQACTSTKWQDYYDDQAKLPGSDLTEYTRAVICELAAVDSSQGEKACVVGPDGQMRCFRQEKAGQSGGVQSYEDIVQVRTVFPNLFEIAEQTIQNSTGFLRAFKPPGADAETEEAFNQAFEASPAAYNKAQYTVSDRSFEIDKTGHENGWKIFFYKLGGLVNAKEFVLKFLQPGS